MSEARIRIDAAGPLASVQDRGRPGWLRFGVSGSGPVDRVAFEAALAAVGSHDGVALELSSGGMRLSCAGGVVGFAVCGPGFAAMLDGTPIGSWAAGRLQARSSLTVRSTGGNWGYVAFAARMVARNWLGSSATHLGSGLGGGAISAGLDLTLTDCRTLEPRSLPVPPEATPIRVARAVLGPQDRFFGPADLARLAAEPFRTTPRMDRMGLVLDGPALVPSRLDMPSEPMMPGNLQVDGEGRATLLLADHQTTGGYPKIATLLAADAARVAQLPPGTEFRIAPVSPAQAVAIARADHARLQDYLRAVGSWEPLEARLMRQNLITAQSEPED